MPALDHKLLARQVHHDAMGLFTWVEDNKNPDLFFGGIKKDEVWHSFIDKLRLFKRFKGDCDDFALTCADALIDRDVPLGSLRLIVCMINATAGHAVLLVDKKWLVDNRQDTVIPWRQSGYHWVKGMDCDELGKWFSLTEENDAA